MTEIESMAADCETVSASVGNCVDGVATVTLLRPDARNALNAQLREELTTVLAAIKDDDAVRVLVLTGADEGGAFVAGADVTELRERDAIEQREASDPESTNAWRTFPSRSSPVSTATHSAVGVNSSKPATYGSLPSASSSVNPRSISASSPAAVAPSGSPDSSGRDRPCG